MVKYINIISYLDEISETNGFCKGNISNIANDICNVSTNSAEKAFGFTKNVQQLLRNKPWFKREGRAARSFTWRNEPIINTTV